MRVGAVGRAASRVRPASLIAAEKSTENEQPVLQIAARCGVVDTGLAQPRVPRTVEDCENNPRRYAESHPSSRIRRPPTRVGAGNPWNMGPRHVAQVLGVKPQQRPGAPPEPDS